MIKISRLQFSIILVLIIQQMLAAPNYYSRHRQKELGFIPTDRTTFRAGQLDLLLVQTLREISDGPFKGKSIILLIDNGNVDREKHNHLLSLLKKFGVPLTLIQVAETDGVAREEGQEDVINNKVQNVVLGKSTANVNNHSITKQRSLPPGGVLLYIPNIMQNVSLLNQAPSSEIDSLLIISIDPECNTHSLLQTVFALRMRYVAFLCPISKKQHLHDPQSTAFRVYSWRPFQPHQKIVDLGIWSPSAFLSWNDLFIERFDSFEGQTLHVASDKGDMPFLLPGTEEEYIGISKNIIDVLSVSMNFSYTLTPRASDGRWGMKEDGEWVGLYRDMLHGGKNLTINSFALTWERCSDFDFSVPYFTTGFGFSVLKPPLLPRWMNLTYTFTMEVWLATAVSLIFASVGFYLISSKGRHDHHQMLSPFNSFLIVIQGLLKQSLLKVPKSWLMRVFLAIWWLGTYVIIASYSCNLIAMLTVPLYPPKLHSVEQLAESDYRFCMIDFGYYVPKALATSKDASLFTLGSRLDLVPRVDQGEHGATGCIDLVLSGDSVQIEFFPYMQYIYSVSGITKKIYYPRELIYKSSLAFFFLKGTPWIHKFSLGIQRLIEAHLIEKWNSDILQQLDRQRIKEEGERESTNEPLQLGHLQGPFIMFIFGVFLSNTAFLLELLGHRFSSVVLLNNGHY